MRLHSEVVMVEYSQLVSDVALFPGFLQGTRCVMVIPLYLLGDYIAYVLLSKNKSKHANK